MLETLAYRLQLPHMDGTGYGKNGFEAAKVLLPYLELQWGIERSTGFFFRAEDFGDLLNSIDRTDARLHAQLQDLEGEVPDHIIQEMKDSANHQLYHVRRNYGQDLQGFSHGEAYLKIMHEKISRRGIFLLDEPEAALSPTKQLALIYFIHEHLQSQMSQFIIATHSPMLMAYPGATLYEITEDGMASVALEDTEHYSVTKGFLNNPEGYLRFLK
ncbi:MAG: AAA family ATPase [Bacteroidota bacterium]